MDLDEVNQQARAIVDSPTSHMETGWKPFAGMSDASGVVIYNDRRSGHSGVDIDDIGVYDPAAVPEPIPTAATPEFAPDGGSYTTAQTVIISCATSGATIRYTTDGSIPTETNGTVIASGSSIVVDHDMTLKAKAWATGYYPSGVKSSIYTFPVVSTLDNDASGNNLAYWQGTANSCYGGTSSGTTSSRAIGNSQYLWTDLCVKIDVNANTSSLYLLNCRIGELQEELLGTISHGSTPGSVLGGIKIERLSNASAINHTVYLGELVVGDRVTEAPPFQHNGEPFLSIRCVNYPGYQEATAHLQELSQAAFSISESGCEGMRKVLNGNNYLVVINRTSSTKSAVSITLPDWSGSLQAQVLFENRAIGSSNNTFTDSFQPWDTHVYLIQQPSPPPGPIANFMTVPGDREIALSWTNPSSTSFSGTMIRYKTDTYPTSPDDGILVCDKANTPGSSDTFTHMDLSNTSYYYSAFARSATYSYSSGVNATATPTLSICFYEPFTYSHDPWLMGNLGWAGALQDARITRNTAFGSPAFDGSTQAVDVISRFYRDFGSTPTNATYAFTCKAGTGLTSIDWGVGLGAGGGDRVLWQYDGKWMFDLRGLGAGYRYYDISEYLGSVVTLKIEIDKPNKKARGWVIRSPAEYIDTGLISFSSNPDIRSVVIYNDRRSGHSGIDLDDLAVSEIPTTGKLAGQVILQDFSGNTGLTPVRIEFIQGGNVMRTERVYLGANGSYLVSDVTPGMYNIAFTACQWLRKIVTGKLFTAGNTTTCDVSLINGDVNGDNAVTDTDDLHPLLTNLDKMGDR